MWGLYFVERYPSGIMDLLTAEDSQFSLRKLGDEGALFHDFEIFEKVLV